MWRRPGVDKYYIAGFVLAVWLVSTVVPERALFLFLLLVLLGMIATRWQEIDEVMKEVWAR